MNQRDYLPRSAFPCLAAAIMAVVGGCHRSSWEADFSAREEQRTTYGGNSSANGAAQPDATRRDVPGSDMPRPSVALDQSRASERSVNAIVAAWPARPRLGAVEMIDKYGLPQEASSQRLIWHNPGPFKRIAVMNLETPHDFPLPHVDYIEHTIAYDVPLDKVRDLIDFDASSTINRTVGELSARCDLEGHNVLTLNLDHDIVTGRKTVQEARKAFGDLVGEDVRGKHPAYVEGLQFTPGRTPDTAFSDKPVIPGAPVRAADQADAPPASSQASAADAEVLASIIAVDLNEVLAASQAEAKQSSAPIVAYAKMLHEAHGTNMVAGMTLATRLGVTPVDTVKVDRIKVQGAGDLADLVPLRGPAFERAYLTAMVKGHTDALAMIDSQLLPSANDPAVKQHLATTRAHVADHLAQAKTLQNAAAR